MNDNKIKQIINKVASDYNEIAEDFSSKRNYNTNDLINLSKICKSGDKVLDFGCGNGRFSELISSDCEYLGVDISKGLIKIAQERYPDKNFKVIGQLPLNLQKQYFDIIFTLAVFHHIPDYKTRLEYLLALKSLLITDGKLVLTVWLPSSKSMEGSMVDEDLDQGDVLVKYDDNTKNKTIDRYVHIFDEKELKNLISDAGFDIIDMFTEARGKNGNSNLCLICKKSA